MRWRISRPVRPSDIAAASEGSCQVIVRVRVIALSCPLLFATDSRRVGCKMQLCPYARNDWTRDNCAVGNTLAVIGERWTLLVLREAFLGVRRFEQIQRNTGIARNILSDRLNTLVAAGNPPEGALPGAAGTLRVRLTETGPRPLSRPPDDHGLGSEAQRRKRHEADPQAVRRDCDAAARVSGVRRAGGCARHARRPRRGAGARKRVACRRSASGTSTAGVVRCLRQ